MAENERKSEMAHIFGGISQKPGTLRLPALVSLNRVTAVGNDGLARFDRSETAERGGA